MEIIDLKLANEISKLIQESISSAISYEINIMDYDGQQFDDFRHEWIDGKNIPGAFKIIKKDRIYFIFLVNWYWDGVNKKDVFPLVVHVKGNSSALFSSFKYEIEQGFNKEKNMKFRYKPSKRDGKNEERKNLFSDVYHGVNVKIKLPKTSNEVERFLNEVIKIVDIRINIESQLN